MFDFDKSESRRLWMDGGVFLGCRLEVGVLFCFCFVFILFYFIFFRGGGGRGRA